MLLFLLFLLLLVAVCILLGSYAKSRLMAVTFSLLFSILSVVLYAYFGDYKGYQLHQLQLAKQQQLEASLKTFKTSKEVVEKLIEAINKRSNDPKGWYLLGSLYSSMGDIRKASEAYSHAYRLNIDDIKVATNYLLTLYLLEGENITPKVQLLVDKILESSPQQLDVLVLLTHDAYRHKQYVKARRYGLEVLDQLPQNSKLYRNILALTVDFEK